MILTIDFTPTEQERVAAAARQKGLDPAAFIKKLIAESLPPVPNATGDAPRTIRDPELAARVRAVRGKYAHTAKESGSEELHRERQRDKEKDEAQVSGIQL